MGAIKPEGLFAGVDRARDLKRRSARGAFSSLAAKAILVVLMIVRLAILGRILLPAHFGLVAAALVLFEFAIVFKDLGLTAVTLEREELTAAQASACFWINVLVCLAMAAVICALAQPAAAWFERQGMIVGRGELAALICATGGLLLVEGALSQHRALLARHLRFDLTALAEVGAMVVNLAAAVAFALLGFAHWALIIGLYAEAVATALILFACCPWRPGPLRLTGEVKEMVRFGLHVSGFQLANNLARRVDKILVMKLFGESVLGLYTKAFQIFMMPVTSVRQPVTQVAIPALASIRGDRERFANYLLQVAELLAFLTVGISAYCIVQAGFVIRLLLGPGWEGAVPLLSILAVAGLILPLGGLRGTVLLGMGRSKKFLRWGCASMLFTVTGLIVGVQWGVEGMAWGLVAAHYLLLPPSLRYCFADTGVPPLRFARVLLRWVLVGGAAAAATWLGPLLFAGPFAAGFAGMAAFGLVYLAAGLAFTPLRALLDPRHLRQVFGAGGRGQPPAASR